MIERLRTIFASASGHRRLVIPYVCAGDPDIATSRAIIRALGDAGAEIVEVGIPFGDPVGDGPTVAAAAQRALRAGMTLERTLDICAGLSGGPAIVLFGYLNPISRYGIERFAADARSAGVCGAIVADLPFDEAAPLSNALRRNAIASIHLVSATTPIERAARIAETSDAFVYVVSRLGVTGASREPDLEPLERRLKELRARTDRPIAVGFGLSSHAQIERLGPHCDAIVVGSALIDALAGRTGQNAADAAGEFLLPLVAAAHGGALRASTQPEGSRRTGRARPCNTHTPSLRARRDREW